MTDVKVEKIVLLSTFLMIVGVEYDVIKYNVIVFHMQPKSRSLLSRV